MWFLGGLSKSIGLGLLGSKSLCKFKLLTFIIKLSFLSFKTYSLFGALAASAWWSFINKSSDFFQYFFFSLNTICELISGLGL